LLDACRILMNEDADPKTRVVMHHAGSQVDALISTVGVAAKLRIKEDAGPPRFRPWTPFPSSPVKPSARLQETAADELADSQETAPATHPGA
jgi:hypothetical protein